MKARLISGVLLIASLSGCASSTSNDECYASLGACLVVGTAQTVGYIAIAALASSLDGDHEKRRDKKKRGH
jgi:hypothetical protein